MRIIDIKPTTAKFYLKHPVDGNLIQNEKGNEVFWEVVGQDSEEYMQTQKQLLRDLEELNSSKEQADKIDYQKLAQKQLASLVIGWDEEFNDSMGGEFSVDYLAELLTDPNYHWMYAQLDAFVAKRKNFFRN